MPDLISTLLFPSKRCIDAYFLYVYLHSDDNDDNDGDDDDDSDDSRPQLFSANSDSLFFMI